MTLVPGVYCDGIKIGSSANVTFAAGVYVINGGGLQINGGGGSGATVNGTGVTFYNTATSGHTYGRVDINGATGTLSAPTSGPMEAMLFFQDRTITPSGSAGNNVINGGEIGDICAWQTKKIGNYTVQLEWSNSAKRCV